MTVMTRRFKLFGALLTLAVLLLAIGCSGERAGVSSETESPISPTAHAIDSSDQVGEPTPVEQPSNDQPESEPSQSAAPSSSTEINPNPVMPPNQTAEPGAGAGVDPQSGSKTDPKTDPKSGPKDGQTAGAKADPGPAPDVATPAVDSITLSIAGNVEWGTVLAAESVILNKGDTVADVLKRAAKANRLSYEIRGSGVMTYIEGIDGLFEFDDGPMSGWKFSVNGVIPDIGAGAYKLKAGDRVEWIYSTEENADQEVKEPTS